MPEQEKKGRKALRAAASEHVCTRRCLRWSHSLGRRFYYCAIYSYDPLSAPSSKSKKGKR